MTQKRARALVLFAARYFDKVKPGWWKARRFSLKRLNLASCYDCVAGQVFEAEGGFIGVMSTMGQRSVHYKALNPLVNVLVPLPFVDAAWRTLIVRRRRRAEVACRA